MPRVSLHCHRHRHHVPPLPPRRIQTFTISVTHGHSLQTVHHPNRQSSKLGDTLRATISCPDVKSAIETWRLLEKGLRIRETGRLKNKWRKKGGHVFAYHINFIFGRTLCEQYDGDDLVVEIQVQVELGKAGYRLCTCAFYK